MMLDSQIAEIGIFGNIIYATSTVIYDFTVVKFYATSYVIACVVIFTIIISFTRLATGVVVDDVKLQ